MSFDLKVLFKSLPETHWKGLTSRRSRMWNISSRNGKLEGVSDLYSTGYRVEVFYDGAIAFGCTSSPADLIS